MFLKKTVGWGWKQFACWIGNISKSKNDLDQASIRTNFLSKASLLENFTPSAKIIYT